MSETAARILLIVTERGGLKLNDLLVVLEKMLDDLERMRYTKACTRTNMPTFISMCPNPLSIIILFDYERREAKADRVCMCLID